MSERLIAAVARWAAIGVGAAKLDPEGLRRNEMFRRIPEAEVGEYDPPFGPSYVAGFSMGSVANSSLMVFCVSLCI
jgi:hypothetical protein